MGKATASRVDEDSTASRQEVEYLLSTHGARLMSPEAIPENSFQHLARATLGQVGVLKLDPARDFVTCEALPAMRDKFLRCECHSRLRHDAGDHQFPPL